MPSASASVAAVWSGVDQGDALACIGVAMDMCSHVLYVYILWPTLIQDRLFDLSFPRCSQNPSMVVLPPLLRPRPLVYTTIVLLAKLHYALPYSLGLL